MAKKSHSPVSSTARHSLVGDSRIVCTSNFGDSGEAPGQDEAFILFPMPREKAQTIVDVLNSTCGDYSPDFYKVVDLNYKLLEFKP